MAMSYCPNCGAKLSPDSTFCTRCGTRIESAAPQPNITINASGGRHARLLSMTCEKCGASLEYAAGMQEVTCNYCGAKYQLDDGTQRIVYETIDAARIHEADVDLRKAEIAAEQKRRKGGKGLNIVLGIAIFYALDIALVMGMEGGLGGTVTAVVCVLIAIILGIVLFAHNQPELYKRLVNKVMHD